MCSSDLAGDVPWHGLGKKVPSDLAPAQMLEAAGLDWTVEKRPLFFDTQAGRKMTDQFALVRSTDEKHLTTVSGQWNPVQNVEAFEFFNDFVLTGNMEMHTAGALENVRWNKHNK